MSGEKLHIFLRQDLGQAVRGGGQVVETSFLGFCHPFLGVAVSVEDHFFMLFDGPLDQFMDRLLHVFWSGSGQFPGELGQGFRYSSVQDDVGRGYGSRGAQHAEFEFISGKGKGRSPVPVCIVLDKVGQHMGAGLQLDSLVFSKISVVLDGFQDGGQLIPQENGDDGRRSLVSSQPVVVAGAGCGDPHQIRVLVHSLDHSHEKYQELDVLGRCFAGIQKVLPGVGGDGPVVVLAASIDPLKGFLMEQADQPVFVRYFLHHFHGKLVVVHRHVGRVKDGRQFVLGGSHFVVFGLGRDPQLPQFLVKIVHIGGHSWL